MTEQNEQSDNAQVLAGRTEDGRVYVVGPQAMAVEGAPGAEQGDGSAEPKGESITDMVAEPAKVMRIGTMTRQLLDEVKAAPLDEASRQRLSKVYAASVEELKDGLSPELAEELERIAQPFAPDATPTDGELRIAQAQLVGWLEGLFHGIQTALFAQQMAARAQLEQMRRALPGGQDPAMPQVPQGGGRPENNGMYL